MKLKQEGKYKRMLHLCQPMYLNVTQMSIDRLIVR